MIPNAIILAAGKSTRFAPFTYERPKGLFRVKGEILIERQINQLIEAGVQDIYIVVGYMKEKFFYLEQKYPQVHLLVNNKFGATLEAELTPVNPLFCFNVAASTHFTMNS